MLTRDDGDCSCHRPSLVTPIMFTTVDARRGSCWIADGLLLARFRVCGHSMGAGAEPKPQTRARWRFFSGLDADG